MPLEEPRELCDGRQLLDDPDAAATGAGAGWEGYIGVTVNSISLYRKVSPGPPRYSEPIFV